MRHTPGAAFTPKLSIARTARRIPLLIARQVSPIQLTSALSTFRCIVPADTKKRVLDATTSFAIPPGSTVWSHGFRGHYEGVHTKKAIADVEAGQWAPPRLNFELPNGTGYGSIIEAGGPG